MKTSKLRPYKVLQYNLLASFVKKIIFVFVKSTLQKTKVDKTR